MSELKYTINDLEKIENFTSWSTKKKVDTLLEIDVMLYANLGTDSSKGERATVKRDSKRILQAIKRIDPEKGTILVSAFDK